MRAKAALGKNSDTVAVAHLVLLVLDRAEEPLYQSAIAEALPCSAGMATVSYAVRKLAEEHLIVQSPRPLSHRGDGAWRSRKWWIITQNGKVYAVGVRGRIQALHEWAQGEVP